MHPPRTLFCTALLAASAFTPHAHTQTTTSKPGADPASDASQKPATLSLNANLVNLPVIVRDKKGALIQTLSKGDFELSVDGHAQTIRYFDHDANLPLTLGLLVDTSRSQRSVLDEERDASSAFLEDMLGSIPAPGDKPGGSAVKPGGSAEKPGGSAEKPDRAFIVQFARETELLQDLTNSRPKLQAGLKQIGTDNPNTATSTDEDSDGNSGRSAHHAGGTTLYDAVFLSGDEVMQKQQGRKALIILSDGVDRNSKETLNRAIEAAQRADTIIYAIYFKGEERGGSSNRGGGFPGNRGGGFPGGGYPGGGGGYPGSGGPRGGSGGGRQDEPVDGKKILQKMADETGGRFFEVKGKQKVSEIYTQIAEELRTQYRLGYTPDQTITGDGYHQVDLRVPAQKTLRIQTRDGYYTGK